MKVVIVFIIGVIFGAYLLWKIMVVARRILSRRQVEMGMIAEERARDLLSRRGYRIEEVKPEADVELIVDGKRERARVQADFLVSKDGSNYIAEVKRGEEARIPLSPRVRRQLLEYFLAFRPDGMIFVDMENERIHRIDFILDVGRRR
jgi:hypothetical protein